jgi:hypothetical protein
VYRIAKITGWGWREITEDLPFGAGLQIIHADDYANGRPRRWTHNHREASVDDLATLEKEMARHGI